MRWTIAVLLFLFCVDASFAESVAVKGVDVTIVSPPGKPPSVPPGAPKLPGTLKHCKVYTTTVSAKFDNPTVQKEFKDTDAVWDLSHDAQYRVGTNYVAAAGGYSVFYKPSQVRGTLFPTWTVYKYERTEKLLEREPLAKEQIPLQKQIAKGLLILRHLVNGR